MMYVFLCGVFFFFKQKTAYEMRISDWSSDVCSSDLSALLRSVCADREIIAAIPDCRRREADARRGQTAGQRLRRGDAQGCQQPLDGCLSAAAQDLGCAQDRKSTRLNSSH